MYRRYYVFVLAAFIVALTGCSDEEIAAKDYAVDLANKSAATDKEMEESLERKGVLEGFKPELPPLPSEKIKMDAEGED